MAKPKVVPISVAVSPDLARKARIQAAREGKSRSLWVREVLEKALAESSADGDNGRHRHSEVRDV